MTPEQWQQVQDLFLTALERAPEERPALLDGHDDTVRAEVEAMLAADDAPASVLELAEHTRTFAAADAPVEAAPLAVGRRAGPYRLVEEVGRGGMGTVYLAERDDVPMRVALKLVRSGLAAPEAVRRFLFERRVLARLDHPHIARMLDAGVAEDGTPYFAMEYVEGVPLADYAERAGLGVADRLALFLQVCDAVAYAHQRLVVHRDLKPSNILVAEDEKGHPQVKLLDFGIAKLLEEEDETEGLTRTGARVMTPEYAAPEQVRGEAVTTATDVYALGVVLYELLAGRRPFDLAGRTTGEIERLICEAEPVRPSARPVSPRLRRQLAGDLDTICLKALEKAPAQRYASVSLLAEDVRRHLAGQPVQARPQTLPYRVRKFVRRYRTGVSTATGMVGVVAVLVGFFLFELAGERDRAQTEATKAEHVAAFLTSLFDAADPYALHPERADTMSARTLLARGARRVETELAGQPEVQGHLLSTIAHIYTNLSLYDEAAALIERALEVQRGALGPRHPDVARTLDQLARLHYERGIDEAAEELYREALAIYRESGERRELAQTISGLATTIRAQGRYEEAEALYREALSISRRLAAACAGPEAECQQRRVAVGQYLNNLGNVLRDLGRLDEAEAAYREGLAIDQETLGEDHPDVSTTRNNLAGVLRARGHYAEAEAMYRESLRADSLRLGTRHPSVAVTLHNLAAALSDQGRHEEAEALRREAIEIGRAAMGQRHPTVAAFLAGRALNLHALGRYDEAAALFREALAIEEEALGPDHPNVARRLAGLGRVLRAQARPAEAEPLYRRAVAIVAERLPEGHAQTAETRAGLGACLLELGRYAEAEPLLLGAHEALAAALGPDHDTTREVRGLVAQLYDAWQRPADAARWRPDPSP